MIKYPEKLIPIFYKLTQNNIKPIIVGGYIRDSILNIPSKDIDVELYNIASLVILKDLLSEFGNLNQVGKSFGVSKLNIDNLEIDFSLPREDSKISNGHKGFKITTNKNLDFKTAASRRDFTINSIGYDINKQKILDPFFGIKDIKSRTLKAVNLNKFDEDPLRALRAIQFCARFQLTVDKELLDKLRFMFKTKLITQLPKERIFDEIQKLLLKSDKPSIGFKLLKDINGFLFFDEFNNSNYENIFLQVDFYSCIKTDIKKLNLIIMLTLISSNLEKNVQNSFINKLTNDKTIIIGVRELLACQNCINFDKDLKNYDIYKLSTKINIRYLSLFLQAKFLGKKNHFISKLIKISIDLGVYEKKAKALIEGKDLIKLGLSPSKEFSYILKRSYEAQMKYDFRTKKEAISWLKNNL